MSTTDKILSLDESEKEVITAESNEKYKFIDLLNSNPDINDIKFTCEVSDVNVYFSKRVLFKVSEYFKKKFAQSSNSGVEHLPKSICTNVYNLEVCLCVIEDEKAFSWVTPDNIYEITNIFNLWDIEYFVNKCIYISLDFIRDNKVDVENGLSLLSILRFGKNHDIEKAIEFLKKSNKCDDMIDRLSIMNSKEIIPFIKILLKCQKNQDNSKKTALGTVISDINISIKSRIAASWTEWDKRIENLSTAFKDLE